MKVVVVTTSYPRAPGDVAGVFVQQAVEALRDEGVTVEVVSPAVVRHYGIAYGDGIVNNLRRRPWRVLALPLFLWQLARAVRRVGRNADVVHAHWLPCGVPALAARRPVVLQLWGSDVALARRLRWLFRPIVRRASLVVCASEALAEEGRRLGARAVRVIPAAVDVPEHLPDPDEPPHLLYVGRLSEEKGVRDLAAAARGLPLVVVGDGPLRNELPGALGFVPHEELGAYYARAAAVVVPSRREGYGMTAREAMAYGRPVVATSVGGLAEAVEDGVTGLLVPPGEPVALREALERVLADGELRERLGTAARDRVRAVCSREAVVRDTLAAYDAAQGVR
jgi:glycosyltransferase involved in cell wall biosynthesis